MEGKNNQGLLNHLHILDLANESGGFCAKLLADMGAHVIKVEKPGGDPCRKVGAFAPDSCDSNTGLWFHYHNTNKRCITLNLETREGRSILLRLLKENDIVIETFAPGYLEKYRLGFEHLKRANEKIILASITGFGQQGPRRAYRSCDLIASAFGGSIFVSGESTTPPIQAFGRQSFYAASLFAGVAIILAVRRRSCTGRGEHLDISLQEAVTATLEHVMVRHFSDGSIPKRQGSLHWNNEFIILPCKDGFIHVTIHQQWDTLVQWMDLEGMAQDLKEAEWQDDDYRRKHCAHIIEVLTQWTKTHTKSELFELGQLMGFPWAPVQTLMDLAICPQLTARGFFISIDHPETGCDVLQPATPFKLTPDPSVSQSVATQAGQHNYEIYCERLGMSEQELTNLALKRVI